jgi:hypothetical protein
MDEAGNALNFETARKKLFAAEQRGCFLVKDQRGCQGRET